MMERRLTMNEQVQLFLANIGIFGSVSWAMFQFLMRHINEGNDEIRQMLQQQLTQYEQQRKAASEVWKEVIRSMQAFDAKIDGRLDTLENRVERVEDCACKPHNDPPTGFP
jgi:F0F1-type ATP synthase membrane subunit b/b'